MVKTYERALGDVFPKTLGPALLETLRSVEYWPTPGHIRRKLNDLESKNQPRPEREVWNVPGDWKVDESTKEERAAYVKAVRAKVSESASRKGM